MSNSFIRRLLSTAHSLHFGLVWLKTFGFVGALIWAPLTSAQTGSSQFSGIAEQMLAQHPNLKSRRLGLESQMRIIEATESGFLPRVDLSVNGGGERVNRSDGTGGVESVSGGTTRASVSVRQPLFDGFEISREAERQRRVANTRIFDLFLNEDALLQELGRAWVDIIRQQNLVQISQESVKQHESLVSLVRERALSGLGRRVDLDQAQGRLSSARLGLASDEGALKEAMSRYQRVANQGVPSVLTPFEIPINALPNSEREAIEQALKASWAASSARETIGALQAELKQRKAAFMPRVAIEGRHDLHAKTSTLDNAASSSLLLTMNMNVYAGGGDSAREQDVYKRIEQAREQLQTTLLEVRQSAMAAWIEAARQAQIYQGAKDYADSVDRAREAYRLQFDVGQRSLLDLLNTENEYAQARRLRMNSWADSSNAQFALMLLTGKGAEAFSLRRTAVDFPIAPINETSELQHLLQDTSKLPAPLQPMPFPLATQTEAPSITRPIAETTVPIAPRFESQASPYKSPQIAQKSAPTERVQAKGLPPAPQILRPLPSSAALAAPQPDTHPLPMPARPAPHQEERSDDLPAALRAAIDRWRLSLEQGDRDGIANWYSDAQLTRPRPTRATGVPLKLSRIDAQSVSDDRVQVSMLIMAKGQTAPPCARFVQVWQQSTHREWQIARERSVALEAQQCPQ